MEVKGIDGRIVITACHDATFRVELHTESGGMAACDFSAEQLNALSALVLLMRDTV